MLKEYPANDLLGVVKRMAELEIIISGLESVKQNPLRWIHRSCRLETMPQFVEPEDGVIRAQDDFWRRNSGKHVLVFPSTGSCPSDEYVILHADRIAATIWNKAREAALYHAHEDLESCRTRLKECRETLLSDEAMKDIILRDEPLQATTRSDSE